MAYTPSGDVAFGVYESMLMARLSRQLASS